MILSSAKLVLKNTLDDGVLSTAAVKEKAGILGGSMGRGVETVGDVSVLSVRAVLCPHPF